ncbi:Uncharacterized protein TCM_020114 [Theobroma cacao]|uniref:Uncharacterized protein n=1 Tax=Theobroma cacao TaxID=3641 RepID=A0A061EKS3_THECC|nr:Uncharacterized protein TCM_020114 [Theobroma cacao]
MNVSSVPAITSFKGEMYLSFAISLLAFIYLFLVVLESHWRNKGVSWLPQDCCFPVPLISNKMGLVSDLDVSNVRE